MSIELSRYQWVKTIKKRDNSKCKLCGDGTEIHAHHIIPNKLGGKDTLENGISLCNSCHRKIHRCLIGLGTEEEKTLHAEMEKTKKNYGE